ncbi:MAG: hypothetical protein WAM05_16485 [Candidatus Binataceae bacterium]
MEVKDKAILSEKFKRIGETGLDERKRVSLSKVGEHLNEILRLCGEDNASELRFVIYSNDVGQILLSPEIGVPLHEAWLYRNPKALASVRKGLQQAAEGNLRQLESFSKYVDDEIE